MVCFSVIGIQRKVPRSMKEKHKKPYLFKRTDQYSGQDFLEDCLSQYRVDCTSENCLSHRYVKLYL